MRWFKSGVTDEFLKACDELHALLNPETPPADPLQKVIRVQTWWKKMGKYLPISRRLRLR